MQERRTTVKLKKPCTASPEQVRITREGEYAVIEYADSSIMTVHLKIGPEIEKMTDLDILDLHNDIIETQEEMAAGYEHVAVEIPRGRPQIEYHSEANQWTPRGGVLRCVIGDGGLEEGPVFYIDDEELTLRKFGGLLSPYAGWGMRIVFVPDDQLTEQPSIEIRDPADSH
jgi:hypothetical protein